MTKVKLVLFSIFGLLLGWILDRFIYLYQVTPKNGQTLERFLSALSNLSNSLQNQPFDFSVAMYPLIGFFAGIIICLIIFAMTLSSRTYMAGREHGSARWATAQELKKFKNKVFSKNLLLSKSVGLNMETSGVPFLLQRNKNVLIVGGSGSGKTLLYVKPNLSQFHSSYVVTDPKGTLVHETGKMMEDAGYKIKVFDINTMQNSDGFNPFAYIHDEVTLKRIIQVVIDATNGENAKKGEPFWDKSEELLLGALFSYLYYCYQGEGDIEGSSDTMPTLYDISELIRELDRKDDDTPSILEEKFDQFEEVFGSNNYAVLQFKSFKNYRGDTRSSIVAIATARFSMFDLKQVQNFLKIDTLDIEKWGEEKYCVYLAIPDLDTTFNFLTTMIFILAFRTLEYQADNVHHGKLPVHVRFILDEFANLGKIPNIKEALSVFRSREISINIILQSINQIKALYKDDWQSLIANCDSKLYLSGGTEQETVKYFYEAAGKATINMRKESVNRGYNGGGSTSYDVLGRDLISQAEVFELPRNQCLVQISSMPMYKGLKLSPKDHPKSKMWSSNEDDGRWYDFVPEPAFADIMEAYDAYAAVGEAPVPIELNLDEMLEKQLATIEM
ncbi:MAG: type IV secretory system conjugative DNA transfer family protein [Streptococcaceae bacterium]|nr:type IV secretory system conjugative DNA transfer family protein [Streptococcaceae bacterium]